MNLNVRRETSSGDRFVTQREKGLNSSHLPNGRRTSGLLALSNEDKARIGNLIKVLAKERRDKEDLQEKLGQQTSRLQDLEREREASQQKEAELVARVTRSVDLLRTYQLEACRKQGPDELSASQDSDMHAKAESERNSPELPPLPQLSLLRPQVAKEEVQGVGDGLSCNALQSADPVPSEAVESARQPMNFEQQIYALKPPQLSVLQRYLTIQESPSQCRTGERQDSAVQTTPSERAASSPIMSPKMLPMHRSVSASPAKRPTKPKAACDEGYQSYQRLRLGQRHCRWTQKTRAPKAWSQTSVKLDASRSPVVSRQSSQTRAGTRNASADSRLTRTLDVPSEPLLGSPLATRSVRQSVGKTPGASMESLTHWPAPLRLESCYAPDMFDVIDSLESGACVASREKVRREAVLGPSGSASISEELRRLQRELVSIQHKISQGPTWDSPLKAGVRTEAWCRDSPCQREIFPSFSLEHWKPPEKEESMELSQEIDDVVHLLQTVRPRENEKMKRT